MNNFVRSETYARARLVSGTIMIVLGAMLLVGMFRQAGFDWKGLPGYVLGLALIGLGIVRYREYVLRKKRPSS